MYGLVNKALQEMVEKQLGPATWEVVREQAGVTDDVFISMDAYPDEFTYRLIAALCEVTDQKPDVVLHNFGRYWVLDTAAHHYGHLLNASGRTFREFLLALPNFHARVSLIMPRLIPPEFSCEEIGDNRLVLHYRSTREGLVPFVVGLIQGLADLFHVEAQTCILAARSDGPHHTAFEVVWNDRSGG
jgi:hypothetical protein